MIAPVITLVQQSYHVPKLHAKNIDSGTAWYDFLHKKCSCQDRHEVGAAMTLEHQLQQCGIDHLTKSD